MKGYHFIGLLLILSLCTSKVIFTNLKHQFTPNNQKEYLNYIQLMTGQHQQSTILSSNLQQALKQSRPSIFNTPQQFILYIISSQSSPNIQSKTDSQGSNYGAMNELLLSHQLKNIVNDISIKIMKNGGKQSIQQIKKKHQGGEGNQVIHIMEVDKNQMKHFEKIAPIASSARRLQQKSVGQAAGTTDSTYLIKFFFSILFVIVILAIIGFIADGSSKKDTLLYAKFIADVGNR